MPPGDKRRCQFRPSENRANRQRNQVSVAEGGGGLVHMGAAAVRNLRNWLVADRYRSGLLIFGFLYAWFFCQGLPFWDDDFTHWFAGHERSLLSHLVAWLSPISTRPQYWGFDDRPLQSLLYAIVYRISGYNSWSYCLYRSIVYAALGTMIYSWGLRLAPQSRRRPIATAAAALFFLLAPGPTAAHIMFPDFATTAELIFLALTFVIWDQVEKTPVAWRGLPSLRDPQRRAWLLRWALLALLTFLGYKSKADLKLIPIILGCYVFLVRRWQWALFSVPIALMLVLAIPWGPGIFSKLPPFLPGSAGSPINWMWQPLNLNNLSEFVWSSQPQSMMEGLRSPTLSLGGLLGPFLWPPIILFLSWLFYRRVRPPGQESWTNVGTPMDRARTFGLIWFVIVLAAAGSLAPIYYFYRVRYGILTMVPASILLAWVFGMFAAEAERLSKSFVGLAVLALILQLGVNLFRSVQYRRDFGSTTIAVDQAYRYINERYPNEQLVLMPDFLPYAYRADAGPALNRKQQLKAISDLRSNYTYVLSWDASMSPEFEMVAHFSGCRQNILFDRLVPCERGNDAYLMLFIGTDPLWARAEDLRTKGDLPRAMQLTEQYLEKYPKSMAGFYLLAGEQVGVKDWSGAEQSYARLEEYFPESIPILYGHAVALIELKQYDAAIDRLESAETLAPGDRAVLDKLYLTYLQTGQKERANETLARMKQMSGLN